MPKLIHKQPLDWKGIVHDLELYQSDSAQGLSPVRQVQAVPFVDSRHIVIFKHIDGYYSLPGGTIEPGESFAQTLVREVKEESACQVLSYGLVAYVKDKPIRPPGEEKYLLRYWAKVRLLDEPINDPCGKALSREVVTLEQALEKLNWSERGAILLKLAAEKFSDSN